MWSKKKVHAEQIFFPVSHFFEVCVVKLSFPLLIIVGMYLRPGVDVKTFDDFCQNFISVIDDVLKRNPFHSLVVAGDFNQYDRSFLISNLSLRNIVPGPTRGDSHLDQIFVDMRLLELYDLKNVVVGPPIGRSDHCSVFAGSKSCLKRRVVTKHVIFDLRLSNILAFERQFLSHDLSTFFLCNDIEQKCLLFYSFYMMLSV